MGHSGWEKRRFGATTRGDMGYACNLRFGVTVVLVMVREDIIGGVGCQTTAVRPDNRALPSPLWRCDRLLHLQNSVEERKKRGGNKRSK